MKTEKTFWARIFVGFREHYTGQTHTMDEARIILQKYVDEIGLCVTLEPTEYIYTNGNEPGCIIGLINYPRFPSDEESIRSKAVEIAGIFLKEFNQYKVSVVMPEETVMLEQDLL